MFHKKEFRKESNIRQLKDKLYTNLNKRSNKSNTYNLLFNTSNKSQFNTYNHQFNLSNTYNHQFNTSHNHLFNTNLKYHSFNHQFNTSINHIGNNQDQELLEEYLLNNSNLLLEELMTQKEDYWKDYSIEKIAYKIYIYKYK